MNIRNLLINFLLSTGMMCFVIYIFYFYLITKIERELFNSLLSNKFIVRINNNKPIIITKERQKKIDEANDKLRQQGQIIFFTMGSVFICLGLLLISMFGFDYYEVLLYNVAIIIATLSAELLFVFIYTKKYILFDDATFISYGIETLKEITTDNYQQNKDQCDFSRPQNNPEARN